MGYACPVCGVEEADAVHLANHLAVTASLGREDHLEWLDEHAPDWADRGPEDLGAIVAEHAPEVETPEFEGAGHEHAHAHDHGRPRLEDAIARGSAGPGRGARTAETETVLAEARDLTRRMYEESEDDSSATTGASDVDGADAADETALGEADGDEANANEE